MSRFSNCNANTINKLKTDAKSKNTVKSTNVWVKTYDEWRQARSIPEKLEETEPVLLNTRLEQFFAELKKKDGKDYEPDCLKVMLAALDRELKYKGCTFSLQDKTFYSAMEVLNGKAKMLRKQGMGKKPNAASSITPSEENSLWESGCLGTHSPRVLLHTLWWIMNQQVGGRGQDGHYELDISEFSLEIDEAGRQYIKYTEGPTKTRQGGLYFKPRPVFPRMYAVGGQRCPVQIFLKYKSKRPEELKNSGALYLSVIDRPKDDNVWYKNSRMGKNTLGRIVKEIIKDSSLAGSSKNLTNHTVRKSTVKKMRASGISKNDIRTVTGHKHSDSLDAYDSGDEGVLYNLSTTLSKEPSLSNQSSVVPDRKESSAIPLQARYEEVHGNVYNITIQNCGEVTVPTQAAQAMVMPTYMPKRLKRIIDSSPDSSQ